MMNSDANRIGVYIHIPFCVRKCLYCDFCSFDSVGHELRERYIRELCREISSSGAGREVGTVFIGGGTPSLLSVREMSEIVSALDRNFALSDDCEFSVEVNPGTVDTEKIRGFLSLGINRISMGMQSASDRELKAIGRIHSNADLLRAYSALRDAGAKNVNLDCMYGIPGQTRDSFRATLDEMLSLGPEHISAYGLMLEEGTPLYRSVKNGSVSLPEEDEECDMYRIAVETLSDAGYEHYEISNYARTGYICRHNYGYWNGTEYLGFGLAASSFFSGVRYKNTEDINLYISGAGRRLECEQIQSDEAEREYIMLRLRTAAGIDQADFAAHFGRPFADGREGVIAKYISAGLLKKDSGRFFLTDAGMYLSNGIICDLMP